MKGTLGEIVRGFREQYEAHRDFIENYLDDDLEVSESIPRTLGRLVAVPAYIVYNPLKSVKGFFSLPGRG